MTNLVELGLTAPELPGTDRGAVGTAVLLEKLTVGTAAPEKLPVSGPGPAVANAFTPESAGMGATTLNASAATAAYDKKVSPVAGALMALREYERK